MRRIVGPHAIVGLSTHTRAQLEAALEEAISYVAIGPIFGTASKDTGYEAVGLTMIREAHAIAAPRNVPVVAIGGITLARAQSVWDAGAASVAVISDLLTDDPRARVAEFTRRAGRQARRG